MFPTHESEGRSQSIDGITRAIGAFVLQFGKVEYALMRVIIEINRIIDGTTLQKKFPYGFDEMCKFLRASEKEFASEPDLPPFDQIAAELEDLNKIRTVLVHSYLSTITHRSDGASFRFERFASIPDARNGRKIEAWNVKTKFVEDSEVDLKRVRSWIIQLSERLEKLQPRYVLPRGESREQ